MRHFTPPPRDADRPAIHGPLTPGAYLKLRRMAAGYSRRAFAYAIMNVQDHARPVPIRKPTNDEVAARAMRTTDEFALLEQPGSIVRDTATLDLVAAIIPFDRDVYRQLAGDAPDRHPRICRSCGCSDHDACITEHDSVEHVCRWVTPGLCSRCVDRGIAAAGEPA